MRAIVLLGPQRLKATVAGALDDLGVEGSVATITAGWEERESEDDELAAHLGNRTLNLELYRRAEVVFARDPELFRARRLMRARRRLLRAVYRRRLRHALDAHEDVSAMTGDDELLAEERRATLDDLRRLDARFLDRIADLRREAGEKCRPRERPAVQRERARIEAALDGCTAVAIAGGHVGILLDVLSLFDLRDLIGNRPVLAWSAGAMALGRRIVLFHDRPPQGRGVAEVLDRGLGLYDGVLPLPHARRRLDLDDRKRIATFASRFEPLTCAGMDEGARIMIEDDRVTEVAETQRLKADGTVREWKCPS